DQIGLPLNRFVTINLDLTASGAKDASASFAKLRNNHFGKWIRRPHNERRAVAVAPTYVWVLERGGGQIAVHWLVHVPSARFAEFSECLPRWTTAVAGALLGNNA